MIVNVRCSKCKTDNAIDIMKAKEGSRILCNGCNEFIVLHFKGETPQEIIQRIEKEVAKIFR